MCFSPIIILVDLRHYCLDKFQPSRIALLWLKTCKLCWYPYKIHNRNWSHDWIEVNSQHKFIKSCLRWLLVTWLGCSNQFFSPPMTLSMAVKELDKSGLLQRLETLEVPCHHQAYDKRASHWPYHRGRKVHVHVHVAKLLKPGWYAWPCQMRV